MRHLTLVACLALTGSLADAKPVRRASHRKHRKPNHEVAEPVAVELHDAPASPPQVRVAKSRDWHVAFGPYLWASSVDANVALGSEAVSTGVDFLQTARHARYGIELLGELRYGEWSVSGDFMYGVVALTGGTEVGPLMVTLGGEASSLLVDGMAGYTLAGDDRSTLSLELRAGVRYQRTQVSAAVDVAGSPVMVPEIIDTARDGIAGARVFVRPTSWLFLAGTADMGLFGTSTSTWSAAADAGVHIGAHVLASIGWRTLEIDGAQVSLTMHGPRAAVQVLF